MSQLNSVFDIAPSSYSRISANVYGEGDGSLNHETDLKVQRAVKILLSGFNTKVLSQTTMKQPDIISSVLLTIEHDLPDEDVKELVDAELPLLISAAQSLLP
ncbi:MAG: hypothetical protein MJK15_00600 [Colwellia sp.]|nr:hypothetical protein [Colwellia sp.]